MEVSRTSPYQDNNQEAKAHPEVSAITRDLKDAGTLISIHNPI